MLQNHALSWGGRRLPAWAIGLSILATYLSSISFLANPGKAYATDWRPFVFSLTIPLAAFVASRWFIPFYRERIQTTAYEHLERRFGYWARAYGAISIVLLQIGRFAVVLYLIALAFGELLGWDLISVILLLGVVTIAYTTLGGFEAVVWTDVVQAIVLIGGALIAVVLLVLDLPGGFGQIIHTGWMEGKFGLGGFSFDLLHQSFWVILLFGIVENLRNFGVDQNYVQRMLSAHDTAAARRSLWLGALLYVPVSALFFFIGTALYVYYQAHTGLGLPAKPDQIFPFFIVTELPHGLVGILLAAILAAGMSTLDSSLNTSATVCAVDFYQRLKPNADEHKLLVVTRGATLLIGILGTAAALLMIHAKTVLDVWWQLSAIFGGAMLGLFLLGLLVPGARSRDALWGVIVGILVVAWATLTHGLQGHWAGPAFPFNLMLVGLAGTLAVLLIGLLGSLLRPARRT
ncbi:MAG: sodium:solute symporter [Gammaproteobacteria bacterium]